MIVQFVMLVFNSLTFVTKLLDMVDSSTELITALFD